MWLFVIDFEVKGRNYYMEVLDSMWFLSNLKEMNNISRMMFSVGQILLLCVQEQIYTHTCSQKCEEGYNWYNIFILEVGENNLQQFGFEETRYTWVHTAEAGEGQPSKE